MRKLLTAFLLSVIMLVSACAAPAEEIKYSENILFSIDHGAPGFGTQAQCADAEIYVHTDKTARVFMTSTDYKEFIEISRVELSDKDYEKLEELCAPEKIKAIKTRETDATDGSSYHITLYGENDEQVFSTGGYMPEGKKFWETRDAVLEILFSYGIHDTVVEYRETLEG